MWICNKFTKNLSICNKFTLSCAVNWCDIHWPFVNTHFLHICAGNWKRFSPTEYSNPESEHYIQADLNILILRTECEFAINSSKIWEFHINSPCAGNWSEIHLLFVNIDFLPECSGKSCEIHWHYVNICFLPICAGNSKWFSPTEYTYPES